MVESDAVCNILQHFSLHTSKAMHSSDNTRVSKFKVLQPILEEKQWSWKETDTESDSICHTLNIRNGSYPTCMWDKARIVSQAIFQNGILRTIPLECISWKRIHFSHQNICLDLCYPNTIVYNYSCGFLNTSFISLLLCTNYSSLEHVLFSLQITRTSSNSSLLTLDPVSKVMVVPISVLHQINWASMYS